MELKHVIPNMEKTFGQLEYAGEGKVEQRRINGKPTILSRGYNLYSDIQRAEDIVVILPAEAGEKHFEIEQKVKLVNSRITAEGYKIGTRSQIMLCMLTISSRHKKGQVNIYEISRRNRN